MNNISVRLRDVPFPEATVLPRREGLAPTVVTSSPSVGGIAERQTLVGHCPQRFSGSSLCIVYRGVACTERGQHLNRKALEPPFAVGAFFAQYRLGPPAPTDLTPAEPTADSSPTLSLARLVHRPRRRHLDRSAPIKQPASRTPNNLQNLMWNTPHAPPEVTRVGLTAWAACTPFGSV
jgi:hypothetical protein